MSLKYAHKGYEYQDLVTVSLILDEILLGNNDTTFHIDYREIQSDIFDDLLINRVSKNSSKIQFKRNDPSKQRSLKFQDLFKSTSNINIENLYRRYLETSSKQKTTFYLAVTWSAFDNNLNKYLTLNSDANTLLDTEQTKSYSLEPSEIWGEKDSLFSESNAFDDYKSFQKFCEQFFILTSIPNASLDVKYPGLLEKEVFNQISKLGIGKFPNDQITIEEAFLYLIQLIKNHKGNSTNLTITDVYKQLELKTDYGAIEQEVQIDKKYNIQNEMFYKTFIENLIQNKKVILTGEPGSGKSWLVENLSEYATKQNIKIVRHFCYVSLADQFSLERIKKNRLYGNLISEIIRHYPHLEKVKEEKYASTLDELNLLLGGIQEKTLLIIDGLDHIDRIYNLNSQEVLRDHVNIIEAISKIEFKSDNVSVLLVSQPIVELDTLENFYNVEIPTWSILEVKELLKKKEIEDIDLSDQPISDILLEKSNGNPLYLNYLLEEIKKVPPLDINSLANIPNYSYNLGNYYQHILDISDEISIISRVLSGADFYLNIQEIKEITGMGDFVDKASLKLSPILRHNHARDGVIIYHESFRRFVLDKLKNSSVDIEKAVYSPLIDWFENQKFFESPKAFRYFLRTLLKSQQFEKGLKYIENKFVEKAVVNGQPWQVIEDNYHLLVRIVSKTQHVSSLIRLFEIGRMLSSTEDQFYDYFEYYCRALKNVHGPKRLSTLLYFNGKPTLSLDMGLTGCYICSDSFSVPWDIYLDQLKQGSITVSQFRHIIKYHLIHEQTEKLVQKAKRLLNEKNQFQEYINVYILECRNHKNKAYINLLKEQSEEFRNLVNPVQIIYDINKLGELISQIKALRYPDDEDIKLIKSFFHTIETCIEAGEQSLINFSIQQLSGINWFYNWMIFYIEILRLKKDPYDFEKYKKVWELLTRDLERFKGKPRTCDLYKAENYILETLVEALSDVNNKKEWGHFTNILFTVTSNTTSVDRKRQRGPLVYHRLTDLLERLQCNENISVFEEFVERIIEQTKDSTLFGYLAQYYFVLSGFQSKLQKAEQAKNSFSKGVNLLLAYTFRKDNTLSELFNSFDIILKIDDLFAAKTIKKLNQLTESVVDHTDGKGTKHYPKTWFEHFIKTDSHSALKYVLNCLSTYNYDWITEDQLLYALQFKIAKEFPLVGTLLTFTFPCETSEDFFTCCEKLISQESLLDPQLSKQLLEVTFEKAKLVKKNNYYSSSYPNLNTIFKSFSEKLSAHGIETEKIDLEDNYLSSTSNKKQNPVEFSEPINDSTLERAIEFFKENPIGQIDGEKLSEYLTSTDRPSSRFSDLIKLLAIKHNQFEHKYSILSKEELCRHLQSNFKSHITFLVFWFTHDVWYSAFADTESLKKAYQLDKGLAEKVLFDAVEEFLNTQRNFNLASSNLIKALFEVGISHSTLKELWSDLYSIVSYRLPEKDENPLDQLISSPEKFSDEELSICILISRLRVNTTERHHWALAGIYRLIYKHPHAVTKPLNWFLEHREEYLEITFITVLQMVVEAIENGVLSKELFEPTLINIYPTRLFFADSMIQYILPRLNANVYTYQSTIIYPTPDQKKKSWLLYSYRRLRQIESLGVDIDGLTYKFDQKFHTPNQDNQELEAYLNRVYRLSIKHIYKSNYIYNQINREFYSELLALGKKKLMPILSVDYKLIVGQQNSVGLRQGTLKLPSEYTSNQYEQGLQSEGGWVRLAHFEREIQTDVRDKTSCFDVFSGICFETNSNNKESFPFSLVDVASEAFFVEMPLKVLDDSEIVIGKIETEDHYEYEKLLWLNPNIAQRLKISNNDFPNQVSAKNGSNETVLRYRAWSSRYLGDRDLDNEYATLDGSELLIRKDYFEILSSFFDIPPSYKTFSTKRF